MRSIWQDVAYGWRVLRSGWGFTVVAVLTLAIGIASASTVFSWVDAVLLKPLPGVSHAEQLMALEQVEPKDEDRNISYPDFRDYRDSLKLVSGVAVALTNTAVSVQAGEGDSASAQMMWAEFVSGNYFDVMGVKPVAGRFFQGPERGDQPRTNPVAVISERTWRARLGSDPRIIGRTIRVNRTPVTVIGIAPAAYCGMMRGLNFDLWLPVTIGPLMNTVGEYEITNRGPRGFNAIARLKPGVPLERARAELQALAAQLAKTYPKTNENISATLLPEAEMHAGAHAFFRKPLRILMAMCLVVLLIACVNVANLLLTRAAGRRKEIGIRLALGAGRVRIVRQLLTETLLLASGAAALGLVLTLWLQKALMYMLPQIGLPVGIEIRMTGAVVAFCAAACVTATLIAGVSPALQAIRPDVSQDLKEAGRSVAGGARAARLRSAFVVSQVALALVALVAAGLFLKSFQAILATDPGFEPRNLLVSRFSLATSSPEQRLQFVRILSERLASAPGVTAAAYADQVPCGFGLGPSTGLIVPGYIPAKGENTGVARALVGPGYFATMRMPLLHGRDFNNADDAHSAPVVIVNSQLARKYFRGENPVGQKVRTFGRDATIVGLVKDSKYYYLDEKPRPYLFVPFLQTGVPAAADVFARTAGKPEDLIPLLRREVSALDPSLAVFDSMSMTEYMAGPMFPQKMAATLLSVLGALALVLAAVGLYSVVAYTVTQRTQEIGVRMALGARPSQVLAMVISKAAALTGGGIVAGACVLLAGARFIGGVLTNVSPSDPLVFAQAVLFLALVALAASYIPARRASRVNPVTALRCE